MVDVRTPNEKWQSNKNHSVTQQTTNKNDGLYMWSPFEFTYVDAICDANELNTDQRLVWRWLTHVFTVSIERAICV